MKRQMQINVNNAGVLFTYGLCAFPNIVINKKVTRKSGKLRRKRTDMMQTVVNNVGVLFMWSVHISKYGNQHKYNQKIRQNQEEKNRGDVDRC